MSKSKKTVLGTILCAVMAVCLIMGTVSFSNSRRAYASEEPQVGQYFYTDLDGSNAHYYWQGKILCFTVIKLDPLEVVFSMPSGTITGDFEIPESVSYNGYDYAVTEIDQYAFGGSTATSITVPSTVRNIKEGAFSGINTLTSITVKALEPPTLGDDVFSSSNSLSKIYVPASMVQTYKQATGWSGQSSKIQEIKVKVSDLLPKDFPTDKENGWANEKGARLYLIGNDIYVNDNIFTTEINYNTTLYYSSTTKTYYWYGSHGGVTLRVDFNTKQDDPYVLENIKISREPSLEADSFGTYCIVYSISATANENGSVSLFSESIRGGTSYTVEQNKIKIDEKEIVATASEGYEFDCWKIGEAVVSENGTITADTTFTAYFKKTIVLVNKPTADTTNFIFDGKAQTYTIAESEYYTVSGNVQTDIGTYVVTVSLSDKVNTKWADGTTDDLTFSFVIGQGEIEQKDEGLSAGAIVGIVGGSVVLLTLTAYLLGYFIFYKKGKLEGKKIIAIYNFLKPRK